MCVFDCVFALDIWVVHHHFCIQTYLRKYAISIHIHVYINTHVFVELQHLEKGNKFGFKFNKEHQLKIQATSQWQ